MKKTWIDNLVTAICTITPILFVCLLPACPHNPPVVLPTDASTPACTAQMSPTDVCGSPASPAFTIDGIACAQCTQKGCYDARRGVYCVDDVGCADPRCAFAGARRQP